MKKGAHCIAVFIILFGLSPMVSGQDCSYDSVFSDFTLDTVCSPVIADWTVNYDSVADAGGDIRILFTWGDGNADTVAAIEIDPLGNRWEASGNHMYLSADSTCTFVATARLMVDGESCPTSELDTLVKVWDTEQNIILSPSVHEVCVGDSLSLSFEDLTVYNCNPAVEPDSSNLGSRWAQWVYGTNSSLTGSPVLVDGVAQTYPFEGPVKEYVGTVSGSEKMSLSISIDDDHQAGEEFEVELRYWNHCNPYEPGPSATPVTQTALIRIVEIPDATITPVSAVCVFDPPFAFTAATAGGSWSGPGIDSQSGVFSPMIAGTGTHEIIYQLSGACISYDTTEIEVKASPPAQIEDPGLLSNTGSVITLTGTPAGGNWSGTGITNAALGTFDPTLAGAGIHTVSYVAPSGDCPAVGTRDIAVAVLPRVTFLTPDGSHCAKVPAQIPVMVEVTGTDTSSFELIIESRGTLDTLSIASPRILEIITENQAGDNIYRLLRVIEHLNGYSQSTELSEVLVLHVFDIPDIQMDVSHFGSCSPVAASFSVNDDFQAYLWDFGDGSSSSEINPEHVFSFSYDEVAQGSGDNITFLRDDSTFVVWLKATTTDGCVDSAQYHMLVHPTPEANFSMIGEVLTYPDTTVQISNMSSGGDWYYHWDFGDETASLLKEPETHGYASWGLFELVLRVFSDYCSDTIARQVRVAPPPAVAAFEVELDGCAPYEAIFQNTSEYADSYQWEFGDGTSSTEADPTHIYAEAGSYQVKLTATGPSGTDVLVKSMAVHPRPELDFQVSDVYTENLLHEFAFENLSHGGLYYLWDFGDGTSSADVNPLHVYGETGGFTVTLIGGSEMDCLDTLVMPELIRVVIGEGSVEFPTAFKWTGAGPGDGNWQSKPEDNSIFHPTAINVSNFSMIIYSRWGLKLFQSNELYVGWDGYLEDGKLASEGVYVYKATVTFADGSQSIYTGDVTFLHAGQ